MAICVYCKKPAGFLRWKHVECSSIHVSGVAELKRVAGDALRLGTSLETLPATLNRIGTESFVSDDELRATLVGAWTDAIEHRTDQSGIDIATEDRLVAYIQNFALTQADLDKNHAYTKFIKALVLRDLAEGKLSTRCHIAGPVPVNLQKGEQIIWLFPRSSVLEDKTYRRYVGSSSGVSVRVARGVYYRTGSFRGHPVEHTQRVVVDTGLVALTNQNIYFVGSAKSFRVPYRKIVSFVPFSDGIGLVRDSANAKVQILVTGDGWFTFNLATALSHFEPS